MKLLLENWREYMKEEEELVDVYHVTPHNNLDKVLNNGIAPSGGDFGEGIYVWLTKESAIEQINSGEGWAFNLEDPVIVEVRVPKSDIWQPELKDVLHTLELDSEEELDLDDEEYYMSMGVIQQSTPVVNVTNVFNEKGGRINETPT